MRPVEVQQGVVEVPRLLRSEIRHAGGKVSAVDALRFAPHPEAGHHEPALEPAAHRRLQRLVVRVAAVVPHPDVVVARVRPQEVVRQRRSAPNRARDAGGILILRLERCAKG